MNRNLVKFKTRNKSKRNRNRIKSFVFEKNWLKIKEHFPVHEVQNEGAEAVIRKDGDKVIFCTGTGSWMCKGESHKGSFDKFIAWMGLDVST